MKIPFNKPYMVGKELEYIAEAHHHLHLAGNGPFTEKCQKWLTDTIQCKKAFLTHSGTAALEIAALLCDIHPGDEIIMPSYTFVSTANAFVLRGGIPVFVDIHPDTLNIDETKIKSAITKKTKAIVAVHYAGVGCEMDAIMDIAHEYNLVVIEDAAHGIMASYHGRALGSIGHIAALSFHETKNIISGEGGALLINDARFLERAHYIIDKGTNRSLFEAGKVDKYTWVDIGSSYRPNEITAAFLWAQIEAADTITQQRLVIWRKYHDAFTQRRLPSPIQLPHIPSACRHNAHMYYILVPHRDCRQAFMGTLEKNGIATVFHYVPLHTSPAGKKYGRAYGTLAVAESVAHRLVRLPLWIGMGNQQDYVIGKIIAALHQLGKE